MKEEDRDAHRLIWVKDPFAEKLEPTILRFTTVTFGAGPSMWHLGSVIQYHLRKYTASHPDIVAKIEDSLYADNFSGGEQNDEMAIQLYREGRKVFREAGMNLRKWKSNSREVMKVIIEEEGETDTQLNPESYANLMLNPADHSPVKVLGTPWDLEKDELSISLENAVGKTSDIMTKVQLLSVSSSIFDVKGLLAPIVFFVKTLFQQVCKDGGGSWKDRVSLAVQAEWDKWIAGARKCMVFEVPRCFDPRIWDDDTKISLVGFSDASKKGFAAVVYLRVATRKSEVTVNLIASKTRVAPLVQQSIPRLELLSALILTRLIKRIREVLQKTIVIEKEYCLIDSAVALHWIQNLEGGYKQYVQDRADECRHNTPNALFRHIPGTENSADLPSRGCTPDVLEQKKDEWFHSRKWVKEDESTWPIRTVEELVLSEEQKQDVSKEIKKKEKKVTILAQDERSIEKIIDPTRFGTFNKLLRVTALVRKFIDIKCKRKENIQSEVSAEDLSEARKLWVKHLQKEIRKEQKFAKMAESLGVQEDVDGFLRCKGRLGRSKLPFDVKHPLLLPSHHRVTELVIWDSHDRVYHDGVKETLAELRSQYWISKGRQRVKTILRKCRLCKLLEGLPYPVPTTADLPEIRLDGGRAFKYTGVDFCGPVYVKTMYQKDREDTNKAYILVFTCATSRMIHLELCPDLSTQAYIRGQQRFMGRRGCPSMIISDNGRTFKGRSLRRFNAANGIQWRFNLARAPWWGGMFERMVRSTKRCLKKAVGSRRLTYEELNTVLVEIEAVLNSRPLTYIYEDDVEVPLTPSHLFCGRRLLDKPEQGYEPEDDDVLLDRKDMITQTKGSEAVVDHFWKRWSREYLVDLREHQKTHVQKQQPGIGVGDVVLIEDDGKKRNNWRLGRIEDIVTGKDGVIRGANVRTANGKIGRPLQKLYPLEVREDLQPTDDGKHVDTDSPLSVPNHPLTLDTTTSKTPQKSQSTPFPKNIPSAPLVTSRSLKMNQSTTDGSTRSQGSKTKASVTAQGSTTTNESTTTTYGSSSTSRPPRTAGMDGEARRRAVDQC